MGLLRLDAWAAKPVARPRVRCAAGAADPFAALPPRIEAGAVDAELFACSFDMRRALAFDAAGAPIPRTLYLQTRLAPGDYPIRAGTRCTPHPPAIAIHNVSWRNHFHWLIQSCFSAWLALKQRALDRVPILTPDLTPTQREALAYAGIPASRCTAPGSHAKLAFEELCLISANYFDFAPNPSPSLIDMRGAMLRAMPEAAATPKRIYISRRDAKNRLLANEAEVEAAFVAKGFTIITLTGRPLHEQARLFEQAEIIAGPHGAGLANLLFCKCGTRVIELAPANYGGVVFVRLGQLLELDYEARVFPSPESAIPHAFDWTADPAFAAA